MLYKVILLLVASMMSTSLYASSFSCDLNFSRYKKASAKYDMCVERNDMRMANMLLRHRIEALEGMITECYNLDEDVMKSLKDMRAILIKESLKNKKL